MLPKITLNRCVINIVLPGARTIEPEPLPLNKPLQLQDKTIWISLKEAQETYGLSIPFFSSLAKKRPELIDNETYRQVKRIWLNEKALKDYLQAHPKHKEMSLAMKKLLNPGILAERAYSILKDECRKPYPDCSRIPSARRSEYVSFQEMADRLGISYTFYYRAVRPKLYGLIKQKPL